MPVARSSAPVAARAAPSSRRNCRPRLAPDRARLSCTRSPGFGRPRRERVRGFAAPARRVARLMLAKQNRVLSAADFKASVRRGRRSHAPHAVIYSTARSASEPTRFGFIVGKAVGGSVTRNLVRRRLRAIGRELLTDHATGSDIVVRALPGVDQLDWDTLHSEITEAVRGSVGRR